MISLKRVIETLEGDKDYLMIFKTLNFLEYSYNKKTFSVDTIFSNINQNDYTISKNNLKFKLSSLAEADILKIKLNNFALNLSSELINETNKHFS